MLKCSASIIIVFSLAACQAAPPPPTKSAPKSATKISVPVETPNMQCRGKIPKSLQPSLAGYRLAAPSDFVEPVQKLDQNSKSSDFTYLYGNSPATCSVFTADFNQDGQQDYAMLLVNQTAKYSQFRLLINRGSTFETAIVTDYQKPPEPITGLVYTPMFFKPAKEPGAAARKNFPIKGGTPAWQKFVDAPAIELWNPPIVTPTAFPEKLQPDYFQFDQLGNSSTIFYFVDGQLKTTNVSD